MNKPTVLLISPQPFYEERGTPIALHLVATGLTELGYDVDFLTLPIGQEVSIPGVNVIRIKNPLGFSTIPIGFSYRKLFLDLLLFSKARKLLKSNNYIRVHTSEEAVFAPLIFMRQARHRIVYDMASSLPEQLETLPVFRLRLIQKYLRRIERYALRNVGYVFCSWGLLDHIRKIAPDTEASAWVFPSHRASVTDEAVEDLRQELRLADDAFPIVYTGSFASYQGLDVVAESIPQILARVPTAIVLLVGGSANEVTTTKAAIAPEHHGNIRVLTKQPRDRIPVFFALAKVLLSSRTHGKNVPLKIFDYMAAEKPIVASDVPAHRDILGTRRAVLYEPNPASLAHAVHHVYSKPDDSAQMVEAATEYCSEHLSWRGFLEALKLAYASQIRTDG